MAQLAGVDQRLLRDRMPLLARFHGRLASTARRQIIRIYSISSLVHLSSVEVLWSMQTGCYQLHIVLSGKIERTSAKAKKPLKFSIAVRMLRKFGHIWGRLTGRMSMKGWSYKSTSITFTIVLQDRDETGSQYQFQQGWAPWLCLKWGRSLGKWYCPVKTASRARFELLSKH